MVMKTGSKPTVELQGVFQNLTNPSIKFVDSMNEPTFLFHHPMWCRRGFVHKTRVEIRMQFQIFGFDCCCMMEVAG